MGNLCDGAGDVDENKNNKKGKLKVPEGFTYSEGETRGNFRGRLVQSLEKAKEDDRYWIGRDLGDGGPLRKAAEENRLDRLKDLLQTEEDPEQTQKLLETEDPEGWTALHRAAGKGHTKAATMLLTFALDPEALLVKQNASRSTPAEIAKIFRHEKLALLLEPAEVGAPPWDGTPASERKTPNMHTLSRMRPGPAPVLDPLGSMDTALMPCDDMAGSEPLASGAESEPVSPLEEEVLAEEKPSPKKGKKGWLKRKG